MRLLRQDGGHGTFTAGCLRAAAPEAELRVLNGTRFLLRKDDTPGTVGATYEGDLADVVRNGLTDPASGNLFVPDVLLVNFAGPTLDDRPPTALAALYDDLLQHLRELIVVAPGRQRGRHDPQLAGVLPMGGRCRRARTELARPGHLQQPRPHHGRLRAGYRHRQRLRDRAVCVHVGGAASGDDGHLRGHGPLERHLVRRTTGGRADRGADVDDRADQSSGRGCRCSTSPSRRPSRAPVRCSIRARAAGSDTGAGPAPPPVGAGLIPARRARRGPRRAGRPGRGHGRSSAPSLRRTG